MVREKLDIQQRLLLSSWKPDFVKDKEKKMNNSQAFNFNDINLLAQSNIRGFLQEWLPEGKLSGHDYCPLNPTRADKHIGSFRINMNTAQ